MPLGRTGEELVEKHYRRLGFRLLERNYIFPHGKQSGELDLIFTQGKEIVFVEVKTRKSDKFGSAAAAVDFQKQRKLVKTAKLYLSVHPQYAKYNYRIDVATVEVDNPDQSVIIIPNAIEDLD